MTHDDTLLLSSLAGAVMAWIAREHDGVVVVRLLGSLAAGTVVAARSRQCVIAKLH